MTVHGVLDLECREVGETHRYPRIEAILLLRSPRSHLHSHPRLRTLLLRFPTFQWNSAAVQGVRLFFAPSPSYWSWTTSSAFPSDGSGIVKLGIRFISIVVTVVALAPFLYSVITIVFQSCLIVISKCWLSWPLVERPRPSSLRSHRSRIIHLWVLLVLAIVVPSLETWTSDIP